MDVYSRYINLAAWNDPSNLKVSKFSLIFSLFLLLLFSFSIFCSDNIYFWINIKIYGLENSFLSRWFSLVYSKVAVLSNLGWKSTEVTGLIPIFAVILKLYKLSVKKSTIIFIISWDSDVLPNFPFTTSETMCDYYLFLLINMVYTSCLTSGWAN